MRLKVETKDKDMLHVDTLGNGMVLTFSHGKKTINVSIDQAAIMSVEILKHVEEMSKKH